MQLQRIEFVDDQNIQGQLIVPPEIYLSESLSISKSMGAYQLRFRRRLALCSTTPSLFSQSCWIRSNIQKDPKWKECLSGDLDSDACLILRDLRLPWLSIADRPRLQETDPRANSDSDPTRRRAIATAPTISINIASMIDQSKNL